ncbi:hypothetical protein AVEN_214755-1 [Araneus ventricosus]|uniref:Uncharacterized protein n=1 Tax=Araneus ventricosus TaxID=182803 RepID=A0A4Y2VGW1_ARAVE|nr:hypothetical protein AVEN_214755-1 [Araneus ventricosus]
MQNFLTRIRDWSKSNLSRIKRPRASWCGSWDRRWCLSGRVAQVSSSDHGSKLRGKSQNSPHAVSKRGVNLIKLNQNKMANRVDKQMLKA